MARSKSNSEGVQALEQAGSAGHAVAHAEQGVQVFFGRSPENIVQPLHRSVEAFNWLGALFQCIEEANNSGDRAQSAALIQSLSSLGAYIAADYQVSIIGEPADELQACILAAREGGAA